MRESVVPEVVDPHRHFGDLQRATDDWMDDSIAPIRRTVTESALAGGSDRVWEGLHRVPDGLEPHERGRTFGGTAIVWYRLHDQRRGGW